MYLFYIEQTNQHNELAQQSRDALSDIIARINSGIYDNPVVTDLLVKLSEQMKNHKGKKVYGYLPQAGRNIVNAIVEELAKEKDISALYDLWYEQRDAVTATYQDEREPRMPLSQNKEFKAIKNAVIQESLNILMDMENPSMACITFEDAVQEAEEFTPDETVPEPDASDPWWNNSGNMYFQYRQAKNYLDKENPFYDVEEAVRWLNRISRKRKRCLKEHPNMTAAMQNILLPRCILQDLPCKVMK